MKKAMLLMGILSLWIGATTAYADFSSGSTGALEALAPTCSTPNFVITLPSDGLLNYTTIDIPSCVTVTFTKNAANTPVYMLASGDVNIAGTINVNGTNTGTGGGIGGPGGYNGGYAGAAPGQGLGPGGGLAASGRAGGGSFGTAGTGPSGQIYGNERLLPLIGGSGGGGSTGSVSTGGGGGGAILIASSGSINISGTITACGGGAWCSYGGNGGGGGSGGGIRLIANSISGDGTIVATGGWDGVNGSFGGAGRIRLEAYTVTRTAASNPAHTFGHPGNVFITNLPMLTITSIANTSVPPAPAGSYSNPDMLLPPSTTNPIPVSVSATNIPDGTTVTFWVIPQYGNATSVDQVLSGSTATANVNISTAYANIITVQTTFTVTAMNYDGEEINKVRVATSLGGKSETTYITKSGKEIKGELIAALMK